MRKLWLAIGAVIVLLVAVVVVLPYFISATGYKGEIVARVKAATGRDLKIAGPIAFSLVPRVAIEASDVTFSNAKSAGATDMVRLKKLSIALKLLPLLGGNIVVDHFVLTDPVIALEIAKDGTPNWNFRQTPIATPDIAPAARPAAAPMASALRALSQLHLDDVRLENGDISYIDRRGGEPAELQQVNLTLSLPSLDQPFNAEGSALWKSEKVGVTLKLDQPGVLIGRNGVSGLSLAIDSKPIAFTFTGSAGGPEPLKLDGDAGLKLPSIRDFAAWAGQKLEFPGNGFGPLAIAGKVHVEDDLIEFSGATLALDAIKAKGEIALDSKGPLPMVKGRLDLDQLDLDPYLPPEPKSASAKSVSGWDETPIDATPLKFADADFNLSAHGIKFHQIAIGQSALALHLHDAKLLIDLTGIALYQGTGSGKISVDASGSVPVVGVNFSLAQVQMAPLARDFADFDRIRGTGSWQISATGRGHNQREIVGSLEGKGSFRLINGAVSGVNLLALMKNTTSLVTGDKAADETAISQASGTYTIARGVLHNGDLLVKTSEFDIKGTGAVDLPRREVDFRVAPQMVAGLIAVPVLIEGPWDNLSYRPDVVGLLKTPGNVIGTVGQGGLDAAGKLKGLFGR